MIEIKKSKEEYAPFIGYIKGDVSPIEEDVDYESYVCQLPHA